MQSTITATTSPDFYFYIQIENSENKSFLPDQCGFLSFSMRLDQTVGEFKKAIQAQLGQLDWKSIQFIGHRGFALNAMDDHAQMRQLLGEEYSDNAISLRSAHPLLYYLIHNIRLTSDPVLISRDDQCQWQDLSPSSQHYYRQFQRKYHIEDKEWDQLTPSWKSFVLARIHAYQLARRHVFSKLVEQFTTSQSLEEHKEHCWQALKNMTVNDFPGLSLDPLSVNLIRNEFERLVGCKGRQDIATTVTGPLAHLVGVEEHGLYVKGFQINSNPNARYHRMINWFQKTEEKSVIAYHEQLRKDAEQFVKNITDSPILTEMLNWIVDAALSIKLAGVFIFQKWGLLFADISKLSEQELTLFASILNVKAKQDASKPMKFEFAFYELLSAMAEKISWRTNFDTVVDKTAIEVLLFHIQQAKQKMNDLGQWEIITPIPTQSSEGEEMSLSQQKMQSVQSLKNVKWEELENIAPGFQEFFKQRIVERYYTNQTVNFAKELWNDFQEITPSLKSQNMLVDTLYQEYQEQFLDVTIELHGHQLDSDLPVNQYSIQITKNKTMAELKKAIVAEVGDNIAGKIFELTHSTANTSLSSGATSEVAEVIQANVDEISIGFFDKHIQNGKLHIRIGSPNITVTTSSISFTSSTSTQETDDLPISQQWGKLSAYFRSSFQEIKKATRNQSEEVYWSQLSEAQCQDYLNQYKRVKPVLDNLIKQIKETVPNPNLPFLEGKELLFVKQTLIFLFNSKQLTEYVLDLFDYHFNCAAKSRELSNRLLTKSSSELPAYSLHIDIKLVIEEQRKIVLTQKYITEIATEICFVWQKLSKNADLEKVKQHKTAMILFIDWVKKLTKNNADKIAQRVLIKINKDASENEFGELFSAKSKEIKLILTALQKTADGKYSEALSDLESDVDYSNAQEFIFKNASSPTKVQIIVSQLVEFGKGQSQIDNLKEHIDATMALIKSELTLDEVRELRGVIQDSKTNSSHPLHSFLNYLDTTDYQKRKTNSSGSYLLTMSIAISSANKKVSSGREQLLTLIDAHIQDLEIQNFVSTLDMDDVGKKWIKELIMIGLSQELHKKTAAKKMISKELIVAYSKDIAESPEKTVKVITKIYTSLTSIVSRQDTVYGAALKYLANPDKLGRSVLEQSIENAWIDLWQYMSDAKSNRTKMMNQKKNDDVIASSSSSTSLTTASQFTTVSTSFKIQFCIRYTLINTLPDGCQMGFLEMKSDQSVVELPRVIRNEMGDRIANLVLGSELRSYKQLLDDQYSIQQLYKGIDDTGKNSLDYKLDCMAVLYVTQGTEQVQSDSICQWNELSRWSKKYFMALNQLKSEIEAQEAWDKGLVEADKEKFLERCREYQRARTQIFYPLLHFAITAKCVKDAKNNVLWKSRIILDGVVDNVAMNLIIAEFKELTSFQNDRPCGALSYLSGHVNRDEKIDYFSTSRIYNDTWNRLHDSLNHFKLEKEKQEKKQLQSDAKKFLGYVAAKKMPALDLVLETLLGLVSRSSDLKEVKNEFKSLIKRCTDQELSLFENLIKGHSIKLAHSPDAIDNLYFLRLSFIQALSAVNQKINLFDALRFYVDEVKKSRSQFIVSMPKNVKLMSQEMIAKFKTAEFNRFLHHPVIEQEEEKLMRDYLNSKELRERLLELSKDEGQDFPNKVCECFSHMVRYDSDVARHKLFKVMHAIYGAISAPFVDALFSGKNEKQSVMVDDQTSEKAKEDIVKENEKSDAYPELKFDFTPESDNQDTSDTNQKDQAESEDEESDFGFQDLTVSSQSLEISSRSSSAFSSFFNRSSSGKQQADSQQPSNKQESKAEVSPSSSSTSRQSTVSKLFQDVKEKADRQLGRLVGKAPPRPGQGDDVQDKDL